MPIESERKAKLGDLLERSRDRLIYEYDFGDSWEHEVVLEGIGEPEPGVRCSARLLPRSNSTTQNRLAPIFSPN